jgi:hypothetical protein
MKSTTLWLDSHLKSFAQLMISSRSLRLRGAKHIPDNHFSSRITVSMLSRWCGEMVRIVFSPLVVSWMGEASRSKVALVTSPGTPRKVTQSLMYCSAWT